MPSGAVGDHVHLHRRGLIPAIADDGRVGGEGGRVNLDARRGRDEGVGFLDQRVAGDFLAMAVLVLDIEIGLAMGGGAAELHPVRHLGIGRRDAQRLVGEDLAVLHSVMAPFIPPVLVTDEGGEAAGRAAGIGEGGAGFGRGAVDRECQAAEAGIAAFMRVVMGWRTIRRPDGQIGAVGNAIVVKRHRGALQKVAVIGQGRDLGRLKLHRHVAQRQRGGEDLGLQRLALAQVGVVQRCLQRGRCGVLGKARGGIFRQVEGQRPLAAIAHHMTRQPPVEIAVGDLCLVLRQRPRDVHRRLRRPVAGLAGDIEGIAGEGFEICGRGFVGSDGGICGRGRGGQLAIRAERLSGGVAWQHRPGMARHRHDGRHRRAKVAAL